MVEHDARQVVWVRWIETTDTDRQLLSDAVRDQASQRAREFMPAPTAGAGAYGAPAAEDFLQRRAALILRTLGSRFPHAAALLERSNLAWLIWRIVPVIAFLFGVAADRIGDPHRVDLLSVPLLLIICWNLVVYLAMLVCRFARLPRMPWTGSSFLLQRAPAAPKMSGAASAILSVAALAFANDWASLSRPLTLARAGRTLHLGAALFAAGAMLSLYLRGYFSEYLAGWESTFLSGPEVTAILRFLFAPAHVIFGIENFSAAEVAALHFGAAGPDAALGAGARWVYLYAATLLLVVLLPRLLLALAAHRHAMRLARSFRLPLRLPYYRTLTAGMAGSPGILCVVPYSFTIDAPHRAGLAVVARMLLGRNADLAVRPGVRYGADPAEADLMVDRQADQGAAGTAAAFHDAASTVVAVLFNLTATPETENHGAFLRACVARSPGITVLIDESGFLERQTAHDGGRMAQRTALWKNFCEAHGAAATIVNLRAPEARRQDLESGAVS